MQHKKMKHLLEGIGISPDVWPVDMAYNEPQAATVKVAKQEENRKPAGKEILNKFRRKHHLTLFNRARP